MDVKDFGPTVIQRQHAMEPIGLTLAVFSTFKEVYLLSQFIGKLVKSAKNSEAEHASLEVEFHFEFLYMRSTGLFFLQNNGVVNDSGLNQVIRVLDAVYKKLHVDTSYRNGCSAFMRSLRSSD